MLIHEKITEAIIGAAIEVHKTIGPGLLESIYEECLCYELSLRNIPFRRQVDIPLIYKGVKLECRHRIDILVDEKVIVELKSVDILPPVHEAKLLAYLKLTGHRVGLLINFNVPTLKDGVMRRIL
ncbi:MAG: GxxExxY protein [Planctomycetes bacterium]|nr:GxxExxY protein [Planctomycetota bacterium]